MMAATKDMILSVENLGARVSRAFKLVDISFTLAAGELVALLGPNGSGKSALLRVLVGLDPPQGGRIRRGESVLSEDRRVLVAPEARGIGIVFQEGVLFPHLDAEANVALGVGPRVAKADKVVIIDAALAAMRIQHLRRRSVPTLSGGEQQRVVLARALAQQPKVMLLDEPFHSVDGEVRREIIGDLQRVAGATGMAMLLVTHETFEAAAFAERVILMRDGRVVQMGTMDTLCRQPAEPWVARFLECARIRA